MSETKIIPAHPESADASGQVSAVGRLLYALPLACGNDEGDQLVTLMGAAITICAHRATDRDEWFDIGISTLASAWERLKRAEFQAAAEAPPDQTDASGMTPQELSHEAAVVRIRDAAERESGHGADRKERAIKLATDALSALCLMLEDDALVEHHQLAAAEELVGSAQMGRLLRGLRPAVRGG